MHRRLQSISTWLASPRQQAYAFVPLSLNSQPSSPDTLGFPPSHPPRRVSLQPLVLVWTWVSPPLVLALFVALLMIKRPDDSVLNPYACKAKALHQSLAKMCEADPKQPDWRMQVSYPSRSRGPRMLDERR